MKRSALKKLVEVFDEMTIKEPNKAHWGAVEFPIIKPNKTGIIHVLSRLLKRLKESLD